VLDVRTDAAIYYRRNNWRAALNFQNLLMLITSGLVRALERPFILVSLYCHRHSIGRVLSYADDTECSSYLPAMPDDGSPSSWLLLAVVICPTIQLPEDTVAYILERQRTKSNKIVKHAMGETCVPTKPQRVVTLDVVTLEDVPWG